MQNYKYTNIPLTPAVAEPLIVEILKKGNVVSRSTIINEVIELHLKKGGMKNETNLTSTIKKALSNLSSRNEIQSPTTGYWKLNSNLEVINSKIALEELEDKLSKIENKTDDKKQSWVYVYYFPTYKKLAELEGKSIWPCKIGRTKSIPLERIKAQVNTAFPETPNFETYRVQDSHNLEGVIHRMLSIRKVLNGSGNEWFNTNPDEVKTIIESVEELQKKL